MGIDMGNFIKALTPKKADIMPYETIQDADVFSHCYNVIRNIDRYL